jgi:hypothetical protein
LAREVDAAPLEPTPAVKAAVLGASARLTQIYEARDLGALIALVAPDYLGSAPGFEWDLAKLKEEFPKIHLHEFHGETPTLKQLAPNLVLLNQDASIRESYDGQDISGRYRMTTIWVHRGGHWCLLFEQEIPLPGPK